MSLLSVVELHLLSRKKVLPPAWVRLSDLERVNVLVCTSSCSGSL